jgi:hypothetical protein
VSESPITRRTLDGMRDYGAGFAAAVRGVEKHDLDWAKTTAAMLERLIATAPDEDES